MWIYDRASLRFLAVNDAAVSLYGYDRDTFLQMRITDIRPEADQERLAQNLMQPRTPLEAAGRWQHLRGDGELLDVEITSHTIFYQGTRAALVLVTDVSEHSQVQSALYQRERELAFLAEASAIVSSSLDYEQTLRTVATLAVPQIADWCVVHMLDNGSTVRELAVAHADPAKVELARELERRYPPDPGAETAMHRVTRTGRPEIWPEITDEMLQAMARDTEHLTLMRQLGICSIVVVPLIARGHPLGAITLVSAESGRRFGEHDTALAEDLARRAAIAVDNARLFRERAEAEEALQALNAELERRVEVRTTQLEAANAELEAFSYSVSHDLRAPLRSVDGFSKVLADRYAPALDARGLHYLSTIREAAQEMGQLIDALLRLARLTRSEMRWTQVDVSALARSIAESLQHHEPERKVVFSIEESVVARGDTQLLRALLENLLGNAWKFSRERAPAQITFGIETRDDETVYFVRDNGAGFDPRYVHKLFGPFQRLHRVTEFEGTGIGLATVQRIVHRHGGRVWAEGEVDQGATISFTLGAPDEESAA